jgi:hypothetical protein
LKKYFFFIILFLLTLSSGTQILIDDEKPKKYNLDLSNYTLEKRQSDSILIYETFKNEIDSLKTAKDYESWYILADSITTKTASSFLRLKKYNKEEYEPIEIFNKEGFGVAYLYPPVDYKNVNDSTSTDALIRFSIVFYQTRFITDSLNMTRIPYLKKIYYDDKGRQIKCDKINPITFEKIKD